MAGKIKMRVEVIHRHIAITGPDLLLPKPCQTAWHALDHWQFTLDGALQQTSALLLSEAPVLPSQHRSVAPLLGQACGAGGVRSHAQRAPLPSLAPRVLMLLAVPCAEGVCSKV